MASALWVMRRCHLVCRQEIYVTRTFNCCGGNAVRRVAALRHLIRDGGRHQLVDLGSVFGHGKDEEGLVVWREGDAPG